MTLTAEQLEAIETGQAVSLLIERTECVLIRKDVYDKVKGLVYDDSDWTDGELQAAAAYAAESADNPDPIS